MIVRAVVLLTLLGCGGGKEASPSAPPEAPQRVVPAAGPDAAVKLTITNIEPKKGPRGGGNQVSISGAGFETTRPSSIYFDGAVARIISIEDGVIVVEVPAGELGAKVTVLLVFDDSRRFTLPDVYTYE